MRVYVDFRSFASLCTLIYSATCRFYPLQFVFFFKLFALITINKRNALPFDGTDDEEKKLLIDFILFSSSCFQIVGQILGVRVATNERKSPFLSIALMMTKRTC